MWPRLLRPYRRYRDQLCASLDPLVQLPGLRALGLALMRRWRWTGGRVSRRQAANVVDLLGSAGPGAVRLLALHHPPFATGTGRELTPQG